MNISLTPHRKGGFLGGFLGILLFAWSPWLMPVGCLVGSIIGMHYQKIWRFAVEDWNDTVDRFVKRNEVVAAYKRQARYSYLRFRVHIRHLGVVPRFFAAVFFGTVSLVYRMLRWPFKGWMSKFVLGRIAAALTAAAFVAAGTLWLLADLNVTFTGEAQPLPFFAALIWAIMGIMATAVPMKPWELENRSDVKMYRESQALASSRWGLLKVCFKDLGRQLGVFGVAGPAFIAVCVAAIAIGLPLLILTLVASLVLGLGIATLRAALEHKHWTCFGVTLAITSVSAFLSRHHLHGAYLWLIAFTNGSVCGFAAESVHQSLSPRVLALIARARKKDADGDTLNAAMNIMFSAVFGPFKKLEPALDRIQDAFRPILA